MDNEFVNLYLEVIVKEVEELTKTRLLDTARYKYLELTNKRLLQKIEELEKQLEKQNKKRKLEVDTSDTF